MASVSFPIDHPPLRFKGSATDPRARKLIEAAYELLGESGLDGLTIRAVLARSGLARRAFYENFTGKDDLVLAVFEQTIRLAADYYREQAPSLLGPMERLAMIVTSIGLATASLEPGEDEPGDRRGAALSREHLRLAESRPADLQAALSPLLDLIAEIVADGIAKGEFRQCDPALQASLIYNLVSTTMHVELLAQEGARPDQQRRLRLAEEIWEFCRRAIAA